MATTARPREALLPVLTPREAACRLAGAVDEGWTAGCFLAASERASPATTWRSARDWSPSRSTPLPISQSRPGSRDKCLRMAADARRLAARGLRQRRQPASHAEVVGFFEQLESELDAAGFYHPPQKRPSMVRNLHIATARSNFTSQEFAPCAASSPLCPRVAAACSPRWPRNARRTSFRSAKPTVRSR